MYLRSCVENELQYVEIIENEIIIGKIVNIKKLVLEKPYHGKNSRKTREGRIKNKDETPEMIETMRKNNTEALKETMKKVYKFKPYIEWTVLPPESDSVKWLYKTCNSKTFAQIFEIGNSVISI